MKKYLFFLWTVAIAGCGTTSKSVKPQAEAPKNTVLIATDFGEIKIKLYDETPLHKDNFIKLVQSGFYDDLLFHRVIKGFMIQGGDPLSKTAGPDVALGGGGGDMARIPAEFKPNLHHKKGVLAAARDGNAEKASSACQFYIVQGKTYSDAELDGMQSRLGITYTEQQRNDYKTIGGTPFLDMNYTVFGEVVEGIQVVDSIAAVATRKDKGDRPVSDVKMRIRMVK
ncbi:MAG: peptidylprolyl isomerase [Bacteroidota bacterium]|jgi:cyclophilin family peptidyl-prolyl cis-trans isomerase